MKSFLFTALLLATLLLPAFTSLGRGIPHEGAPMAYRNRTEGSGDKPVVDRLSSGDEQNIKAKARKVVERFMNLLNTIATGLDLEVPETELIIRKSYLPDDSRIFYDSAVVVVDDLRKVEKLSLAKEKAAYSYLRDFEIFYNKSETASVNFSNFELSNVKKANYLYIKVSYDCLFGNKSKISDEPFAPQKRVAELRLEKINNKWKAWIIDVHFLDSTDIADAGKNDIVIADTPETVADTANADTEQNEFTIPAARTDLDPEQRDALRRRNDSIRTYMAFRHLIDSGKHSLNTGQYILAYQFFNEAETVTNGSSGLIRQGDIDFLQTMIQETRKNISTAHRTPEQVFSDYMQEAVRHRSQRSYDKAIEDYNHALEQKPGDSAALKSKRSLSLIVSNLAIMEARYTAGKYKEAISEYNKAIKGDPANSDYYIGRGQCYEKIKEPKKAMNDYNKAISLDGNYLRAYLAKGDLHAKQDDMANALAAYKICTSLDKKDIRSIIRVAELNAKMGNIPSALTAIDKGLQENGTSAPLYAKKAELHLDLKQQAQAISAYTTAVELDSSRAQTFMDRALCYIQLKQVALAAADFDKASALGLSESVNKQTKTIAADYFNAGNSNMEKGYNDSAVTYIGYAVLLDPANPTYRFRQGECFLAIRDNDKAIENFTAAMELDPANEAIVQSRGLAWYQKGGYQQSIADFKRVISINVHLSETYKYLGDAFLRIGDHASAIANYDAALKAGKSRKHELKDSLRASLYNGRGEAFYALGKYDVAHENFDKALDIKKNIPDTYYHRGMTRLQLNKTEGAEEDLLKSLKLRPGNARYKAKLAEVYFQQKKFDAALKLLNEAIPKKAPDSAWMQPLYLRANCLVQVKNYADAFKDFSVVANSGLQENFPSLNTDLGFVYLAFNQPDSALAYFSKDNRNSSDAMSMYGTAIVYSQKIRWDQAFNYLERAMATKKIPRSQFAGDNRISSLKADKRYKKLIKKYY